MERTRVSDMYSTRDGWGFWKDSGNIECTSFQILEFPGRVSFQRTEGGFYTTPQRVIRKGVAEDEMVQWHHQLNGHEFEQIPGYSEGQGSLSCCSPWVAKNRT